MRRQWLDDFFAPRVVALVGPASTPDDLGARVAANLARSGFDGTIVTVDTADGGVEGAGRRLAGLPARPDLAIVVTPLPDVPAVVEICAGLGIGSALVLSSGVRETGPAGRALEQATLEAARRGRVRIVGPGSLGVMRPPTGLNATASTAMPLGGTVAFLSQSGALASAVLDWAAREHVGFSAFVSVGALLDVDWGDLIDYFGHDEPTRSIVLYLETLGEARHFMSAAREVALTKPIIVIKAGRTRATAQAAASHTGALVGPDEVVDAAFRRCGVLRVATIAELFYVAEVLSKQPRARGPNLAIVTNAGGPGILAADALIAHGGALAPLGDETLAALDAVVPAHWSRDNPVDLLDEADPARYAAAVRAVQHDPNTHGVLVVLTPHPAAQATATAEALAAVPRHPAKPLLASWMGGEEVAVGEARLNRADVPTFPFPDTAARVFTHMWRYSRNLRALYETPSLPPGLPSDDRHRTNLAAHLTRLRDQGVTWLAAADVAALLRAYGLDALPARPVATEDEAVEAAAALGFPVVLKLDAPGLVRKRAVGGVALDLRDASAVRAAFRRIEASGRARPGSGAFSGVLVQAMVAADDGCELLVGSTIDAEFGPVLVFAAGGALVDVVPDRALGLPPLTTTLARRLMERTRLGAALVDGRACPGLDVTALEQVLVRFSALVAEQRLVREVELSPLLVTSSRLVVLDARVRLHEAGVDRLPVPAIRPYPTRYVRPFTLRHGEKVLIRPIRPEDEPLMAAFHETLSDRSVYFRFFHSVKLGERVAHERLSRICFLDYDRDMALVAEATEATGERRLVGVGRLTKARGLPAGEFAIVVSDEVQGRGLGTELLRRLVQVGRDEGLERIWGDILPENREMQVVAGRVGFACAFDEATGTVRAELVL